MPDAPKQVGDKKVGDNRPEDLSHPGMNPDPAERGKELGEENAYGGNCVGTGGHGTRNGVGSSGQPVGGYHDTDLSKFTQEELHPGMNPDPAERGKELGEENADGEHCIGTGGHGTRSGGVGSNQPIGGYHVSDPSKFTQEQLHPGMNPNPAERGRQLGEENADGGHSVGTGGHGWSGVNKKK